MCMKHSEEAEAEMNLEQAMDGFPSLYAISLLLLRIELEHTSISFKLWLKHDILWLYPIVPSFAENDALLTLVHFKLLRKF